MGSHKRIKREPKHGNEASDDCISLPLLYDGAFSAHDDGALRYLEDTRTSITKHKRRNGARLLYGVPLLRVAEIEIS